MESTYSLKPDINLKIGEETVLFFDMDGTLIDTDFANFLSYKMAILNVIQTQDDITYNPNERFNRSTLKKVVPNLTATECEKIVQQKEENYKEYLPRTKLNEVIAGILIQYSGINKTVLVTNCRKERALMTLNYYNLTDKFSHLFFRQTSSDGNRINKFKNAISELNLSVQTIVVFENEEQEIEDALLAGILMNNILSI